MFSFYFKEFFLIFFITRWNHSIFFIIPSIAFHNTLLLFIAIFQIPQLGDPKYPQNSIHKFGKNGRFQYFFSSWRNSQISTFSFLLFSRSQFSGVLLQFHLKICKNREKEEVEIKSHSKFTLRICRLKIMSCRNRIPRLTEQSANCKIENVKKYKKYSTAQHKIKGRERWEVEKRKFYFFFLSCSLRLRSFKKSLHCSVFFFFALLSHSI